MSVTAAKGFTASGVRARISKLGPDLALVVGEGECVGAGMFTANRGQAAPVVVSKEQLAAAAPRAVVINSGNANAATGEQGLADARATAAETAHLLGLEPEQVLVLSTGVIGAPLPLERIQRGLETAAGQLSVDGGDDAAAAILTLLGDPELAGRLAAAARQHVAGEYSQQSWARRWESLYLRELGRRDAMP